MNSPFPLQRIYNVSATICEQRCRDRGQALVKNVWGAPPHPHASKGRLLPCLKPSQQRLLTTGPQASLAWRNRRVISLPCLPVLVSSLSLSPEAEMNSGSAEPCLGRSVGMLLFNVVRPGPPCRPPPGPCPLYQFPTPPQPTPHLVSPVCAPMKSESEKQKKRRLD